MQNHLGAFAGIDSWGYKHPSGLTRDSEVHAARREHFRSRQRMSPGTEGFQTVWAKQQQAKKQGVRNPAP